MQLENRKLGRLLSCLVKRSDRVTYVVHNYILQLWRQGEKTRRLLCILEGVLARISVWRAICVFGALFAGERRHRCDRGVAHEAQMCLWCVSHVCVVFV
jgi:hypothetical protein